MKNILFVFFIASSLFAFNAIAQNSTETTDITMPLAEISVEKNHLEIKIGTQAYQIDNPSFDDPERALFDSLPENDKEAFANNRRLFLSMAARALNLMKYGMGVGSVVKENIRFKIDKVRKKNSESQFSEMTLKERSQQIVLSFLKGIDQKLWQQAPLFARANEFGVMASGGLELIAGKKTKGLGGLVDIGISIGYNRDERSLVIQIINDLERYKSSVMPAIFIAGAVGKAGAYVANQQNGKLFHQGTSYYPPLIPGFTSVTNDNFTSGFSTGLTWPPSPLGDMLTYTDKLSQSVLLRVAVSPMTAGFVRIQSVLGANTLKFALTSVKSAMDNTFGRRTINLCSQALL